MSGEQILLNYVENLIEIIDKKSCLYRYLYKHDFFNRNFYKKFTFDKISKSSTKDTNYYYRI